MPHPLVDQLRFTRSEWVRAFEGVTPAEAERRRQLLGHTELPVFVGNLNRAPYRPETAP